MDKYIFPAIFEPGEIKGYTVAFPDLPGCITEGDTMEEALHMAKEALELFMYGMEEDNETIPKPTAPENIVVPQKAFVNLVEVWMPIVRDEMENKAVKRTIANGENSKGLNKPYYTTDHKYYLRVGTTKRIASRDELLRLFEASGALHFDISPVEDTSMKDLNLDVIRNYLLSETTS